MCVCVCVCVCVDTCVLHISKRSGPSAHETLMATEEEWFPWQQRDLK